MAPPEILPKSSDGNKTATFKAEKLRKENDSHSHRRRSRRLSGGKPVFAGIVSEYSSSKYGNGGGPSRWGRVAIYTEEHAAASVTPRGFHRKSITPDKKRGGREIDHFTTPRGSIAVTPGGGKLKRARSFGAIEFYNTYGDTKKELSFQDDESSVALETKKQTVKLTKESFQELKKALAEKGGRRYPNQRGVMNGMSAKEVADIHNIHPCFDEVMEWLHLIAFRFRGNEGQIQENLVCGTRDANTDMLIIVEQNIEALLEKNDLLTIRVAARVIPGTHIAKTIDYQISNDKKESITFSFDGQRVGKPNIVYGEYSKKIMERRLSGGGEHCLIK